MNEVQDLRDRISVIAKPWSHNCVRLVTHSGITPEQISLVLKKIKYLMDEYDSCLVLEYGQVMDDYITQ